jgi:hypothetical protein
VGGWGSLHAYLIAIGITGGISGSGLLGRNVGGEVGFGLEWRDAVSIQSLPSLKAFGDGTDIPTFAAAEKHAGKNIQDIGTISRVDSNVNGNAYTRLYTPLQLRDFEVSKLLGRLGRRGSGSGGRGGIFNGTSAAGG